MPFILFTNDLLLFSLSCVYFHWKHQALYPFILHFYFISLCLPFSFFPGWFHFFNYCRVWSKANLDTILFRPFSYYSLSSFSASHSLISCSCQNRNALQPLPKDQNKVKRLIFHNLLQLSSFFSSCSDFLRKISVNGYFLTSHFFNIYSHPCKLTTFNSPKSQLISYLLNPVLPMVAFGTANNFLIEIFFLFSLIQLYHSCLLLLRWFYGISDLPTTLETQFFSSFCSVSFFFSYSSIKTAQFIPSEMQSAYKDLQACHECCDPDLPFRTEVIISATDVFSSPIFLECVPMWQRYI